MGDSVTKHTYLYAVGRHLWSLVPLGGSLPDDVWQNRHRFLLGLTWLHAGIIALVGPVFGYSWELNLGALFRDGTVLHTVGEGLCVAFFAALAGRKGITRKLQATAVGFGLMSSSAILVHLSGGYIELHFHFFVMLAFLALYQDWVPYLLAIAYVAIHHGVVGVFWPEEVYNHTAAFNAPWTWAGIHAFFVLWASVGSIIAWRFNEMASARTRLILDSAGEGIYGLDLNGRTTFVNPAAARMLGHEAEELIGKGMHDVLHHSGPDGNPYPKEECPIYAAFKDGVARRVTDEVFWRKDGTSFPVEYLSTPILERQQLRGAVVTFKDITERKRTEATREALYWASLQIQEPLGLQERLARLLQAAHDILHLDRLNILLAEPEGRWLEGAATLRTKDPAETMRIPIGPEGGGIAQAYLSQQPVIWSDSQAPVPEWIRLKPPYNRLEAFRSRAFAILPLVVQGRAIGVMGADRKHSRQPLEPELFPLLQLFAAQAALAIEHARLYEEQRLAAIHLEATVEARTQELRAANIRLEAASRAKSEFLANMSHELRTPLNSVLGFSELLAQQTYGPLTEKQSRYVDNIHKSGRHLLVLISDLLDLSKVEAGKVELRPEPFELREALAVALAAIRPLAKAKGMQLSLQVDRALSTLTADPLRFKQILYNLLSNAVKFTPAAGQITVAVRRLHTAQSTVHGAETPEGELSTVHCEQPGEFVEISVQDTGIGIKSEDLPRLFKPFTQLEPALTKNYEGTGLGLALTKRLVELHGGTIRAESAGEGKGSTFTVRFPLVESRGAPRLLVVDDDETLVAALRDALEAAGYQVEAVGDGAAALAQVEAARPDLVILDLSLPQVNGWEVLQSLRADTGTRALPVLVITGVEVGRGDEILTAGADEFLAKPFSVPVLVNTVQRLLEQGPLADRVRGWQTLAQTS